MNKKIIFIDGDGTLWYPKKTKDKEKPYWIYENSQDHKENCKKLILKPSVKKTLKKLKNKRIITIILSAHPQKTPFAYEILNHKVKYFKINKLFDEIHPSRVYPEAKGEMILKILKQRKLYKKDALMIGDNYIWDYKSAKSVDALILKTEYNLKNQPIIKKLKRAINKFEELIDYIKN